MTLEQIKREIEELDPSVLQELSSFLLRLRREHDPDRKREIAELIDSPDNRWLSLDQVDERLGD